MMGRSRRDQGKLFYEFRLEERIPDDHLLRRMIVFSRGCSLICTRSSNPTTATLGALQSIRS
jgi:hypothetical protein